MDYLTNAKTITRWDPARFLGYRHGAYDPLASYLVEAVKRLPVAETHVVSAVDANRPDLISAAVFNNDTQYWWLLMLYNGLWDYTRQSHFIRIPVGTVVNCFSLDDLEREYFGLRAKQIANPD